MCLSVKLTVFFEEPFWIGIFERGEENSLCVCRVVFGKEPKDYEIYEFVLKEYNNLKFGMPTSVDESKTNRINPKRLLRKIKKETKAAGVGTKAQLAIKQQYEANKSERIAISRDEMERQNEERYELRKEKKKKKHRGH